MVDFVITGDSTAGQDLGLNETGIVTQNGTLVVLSGFAISDSVVTSNISIVNAGTIFGDLSAINLGSSNVTVLNTGLISSNSNVLDFSNSGDLNLVITNHGTIHGLRDSADGIVVQGGDVNIINTGTIIGENDEGIQVNGNGATIGARIFNSGMVANSTAGNAILLTNLSDKLINSGTVVGEASLGLGDDIVVNTGMFSDDLYLGSGDDIYRGFGGTVGGTIIGSNGDDTFFVDQADVVIDGGADYDTVYARADFVSGGNIEMIVLQGSDGIDATGDDDANLIKGNEGANDLLGLGGNDTIFGRAGDDFLDGGGGKDILRGDVGDDVLFGSLGADVMYGGAGSDTFLFTTQAESGIGADRDQIRDFSRGEDVIDISELSDPAFTFEGTGGLSGTGPSIAYFVNANGHAIVNIDVDGDGVRDMQIAVFDNAVLTADDFLL